MITKSTMTRSFRSMLLMLPLLLSVALFMSSCSGTKKPAETDEVSAAVGPEFSGDSAYVFCQKQCDFGPRVMNSEAHDKCGEWIVQKFQQYGLTVEQQKADLKGWDGKTLRSTNIIARWNPEAERRILISAHWDCRPWADNDQDSTNWKTPVLAANDAASGVGVMLELARLLQKDTALVIGIDFVCFDAEDYGLPQWAEYDGNSEETWALGAQYFADNYVKWLDGKPAHQFGILLDMVGGQGSRFYQEGFSLQYAASVVDKIWRAASDADYASYFPFEKGGKVTDDHKPLNDIGLPTVDIIPYFPDCQASSFGPTWHTIYDDMEHLDSNVLKAVGQTLVQVIYSE